MMLKCAACQEEKSEDKFYRNKSQPTGRDVYCKECRLEYCKNGRTWPNRKERNTKLIETGFKKCSGCKDTLALDLFYPIKTIRYGYSVYCIKCMNYKSKKRYERKDIKEKAKKYYAQPHVIERVHKQRVESPRHVLNLRLSTARRRRPTEKFVTIDELMNIWINQEGRCAVSGLVMTWKGGETTPTSLSLDRIDSKIGYICGNVRLVCWMVNSFKGKFTDAEMLVMAKAIVSNMEAKSSEPTWQPHLVQSEAA